MSHYIGDDCPGRHIDMVAAMEQELRDLRAKVAHLDSLHTEACLRQYDLAKEAIQAEDALRGVATVVFHDGRLPCFCANLDVHGFWDESAEHIDTCKAARAVLGGSR